MKLKKKILSFILAFILIIPAFFLCGCGDNDSGGNKNLHDSTKWFTETELSNVGLSNLNAPTGLIGTISSSVTWFNDGYSFSQPCNDANLLTQNAETYLDYFKNNYNGYFGIANIFMSSSTTYYYNIIQKNNIDDYFADNPSELYKFYYVTNQQKDSDGYFMEGSVYTFEIRFEFSTTTNEYMFKLFIEKADSSHNGMYSYYYRTI